MKTIGVTPGGRPTLPVIVIRPVRPVRLDKEVCHFPKACKWPTCSC